MEDGQNHSPCLRDIHLLPRSDINAPGPLCFRLKLGYTPLLHPSPILRLQTQTELYHQLSTGFSVSITHEPIPIISSCLYLYTSHWFSPFGEAKLRTQVHTFTQQLLTRAGGRSVCHSGASFACSHQGPADSGGGDLSQETQIQILWPPSLNPAASFP